MTFSFYSPPTLNPEQSGGLTNIIGKMLSGYTGLTQAKYLPKQIEADIFHKQIAPLAMLASSPYFSSLHPAQQQQIAGYVQQMLSKQMQGNPMFEGAGGMPQAQPSMPQQEGMGYGEGNPLGQSNIAAGQSLAPANPAEHFTKPYTQSKLTPGAPFRGPSGETVYTPPAATVQEGVNVLTKTKGLKKLFDQYSSILPEVAAAPEFRKKLSRGVSEIEKTGLPFTQQISHLLGGSKLSQQQADVASLRAQMGPQLRSLGLSNEEINDIFSIHPGENAKNVKDRLASTWPVIERRINLHRKNLEEGVNVSRRSSLGNNEIAGGVPVSKANPGHMLLMGPDGSTAFVPAKKARELLNAPNTKFKEVK